MPVNSAELFLFFAASVIQIVITFYHCGEYCTRVVRIDERDEGHDAALWCHHLSLYSVMVGQGVRCHVIGEHQCGEQTARTRLRDILMPFGGVGEK